MASNQARDQAAVNAASGVEAEELFHRIQDVLLHVPNGLEKPLIVNRFSALGVGSKIRAASTVCTILKRLGCLLDLNYSQLLYPTEKDVVDIQAFLDTISSAENDDTPVETDTSVINVPSSIPVNSETADGHLKVEDVQGWRAVEVALANWIKAPSSTSKRKSRQSRLVIIKEKHQQVQENESDVTDTKEKEELIEQWKTLEREYRENAARLGRINSVTKAREAEYERLQQKIKAHEKATQLFNADAEGNLQKLTKIVETSKTRLLDLVQEWEEHRVPFVAQLKSTLATRDKVLREHNEALESLMNMQKEMLELQQRLNEASIYGYGQSTKSAPQQQSFVPGKGSEMRVNVVLRVLDSVKQLKKQTAEIEKVVKEVKEIQSDFSLVSSRLTAVEAELDDMIFLNAKKHPVGVESYEFFTELVELFDELLQTEKASHLAEIEWRDRVARCHSIAARVSVMQVDSVLKDLEAIRAENKALRTQQLKIS